MTYRPTEGIGEWPLFCCSVRMLYHIVGICCYSYRYGILLAKSDFAR